MRSVSKGRSASPSSPKIVKKNIIEVNPELSDLKVFNQTRKDELFKSVEIKKCDKDDENESIYPVDQSLKEPNSIYLDRYS